MLQQAAARPASARQLPFALDGGLIQQLTVALLAAAVLETALLRLTTRIGVHVSKQGAVADLFQVISLAGSLAFNFASLLAMGLAALLLARLALRSDLGLARPALVAASAAMVSGLLLTLATGDPAADLLFGVGMTMLVALAGLGLARQGGMAGPARVALALIVVAYLCYQYYALAHLTYRLFDEPAVPPLSVEVLQLGEGLVVVAGFAVFWAWGRPRWRRLGPAWGALAVAPVVAMGLASLSPASTMSILALWTTGLSLFLPFPLYLLALGLYLVTLLSCWRSGDAFWPGAGLLVLLLAGYMPEATYQHLLVFLGVAFLSGAVLAGPGAPAPEINRR